MKWNTKTESLLEREREEKISCTIHETQWGNRRKKDNLKYKVTENNHEAKQGWDDKIKLKT